MRKTEAPREVLIFSGRGEESLKDKEENPGSPSLELTSSVTQDLAMLVPLKNRRVVHRGLSSIYIFLRSVVNFT